MFKKRTTSKLPTSQANPVAELCFRLQKNADKVEKNILDIEELLDADNERDEKKMTLIHQKVNAETLSETEQLLKDLFVDLDKCKELHHPQVLDIEGDLKKLHDRWAKDFAFHRELYNQKRGLEPTQKISWGPLLDEKQKQLNSEAFGPNLTDVEKQIAAHNILQQAIEAYDTRLQPSSTPQEKYDVLRAKYAKLLESSKQRRNHLASLYEYLRSCNKKLVYLSGQQERVLQRDWSDRMADPKSVQMEYEKFRNNELEALESEVNQLNDEGDRLVEEKHPGSPAIESHRDTVLAEWKAFLNLCIAQEKHLDNIENYRKFQVDAETLSESLERLNSTLDPKSLAGKSNSEVLLALEGDEPAVRRNEQRLSALKELSSSVAPLKSRRVPPTKPTTAVSLCDWEDEEDIVRRDEALNLKSNSNINDWELQDSRGKTKTLPGACFMVPPPDAEALEKVDSLDRALSGLKRRRSALMTSLKTPTVEVVPPQKTVAVQSAPEDPRDAELASELDRISRALEQCKAQIKGRRRAPLDTRCPTKELANRLQENEAAEMDTVKEVLLRELKNLMSEEFKDFKFYLLEYRPKVQTSLSRDESLLRIAPCDLEAADRRRTVDLITQVYSSQSVQVTQEVLQKMRRNDLAENLAQCSSASLT